MARFERVGGGGLITYPHDLDYRLGFATGSCLRKLLSICLYIYDLCRL